LVGRPGGGRRSRSCGNCGVKSDSASFDEDRDAPMGEIACRQEKRDPTLEASRRMT
jgi:hypothetical protein